ncbi:FAD-dependent oxidoreductase [Alkalispirochaeta alkalica]|uniref:FAD-dependent oxidoreductase n=1 Tax=Alkalispirochaeta alkalica TaxID=46356 RepID=UPI000372C9A8|nr:NAD(P)/FAD-dependent oxidoreductase [Alkalispirochaeta alkalica]
MPDFQQGGDDHRAEIIIVGGGPTGLLLGNLLGAAGRSATILEEAPRPGPVEESRAIGITPPSLEILEEAGLAEGFLREGLPIAHARVHGARRTLGTLSFTGVHPRFPFILSLPQQITCALLRDGLERYPSVALQQGRSVRKVLPSSSGVTLLCSDGSSWHGRYVLGADGVRSTVAREAGIARRTHSYARSFFMADFPDTGEFASDAHLWFTPSGAVESFPLPRGRRRWIVQLPPEEARSNQASPDLEALVLERTGFHLDRTQRIWESAFRPARSEACRYWQGPIFLAGDAARTMSPIGGQGMNTGFADAELLAALVEHLFQDQRAGERPATPGRYQRVRRRAGGAAANRAALGMGLGTLRGSLVSPPRNLIVALLLSRPFRRATARHFAMITIPRGRRRTALRPGRGEPLFSCLSRVVSVLSAGHGRKNDPEP